MRELAEETSALCGEIVHAGNRGPETIREVTRRAIARLDERIASGGASDNVVPWPIAELTTITGGIPRGVETILGARVRVGKTATALSTAIAALEAGHRVALIELDMSETMVGDRIRNRGREDQFRREDFDAGRNASDHHVNREQSRFHRGTQVTAGDHGQTGIARSGWGLTETANPIRNAFNTSHSPRIQWGPHIPGYASPCGPALIRGRHGDRRCGGRRALCHHHRSARATTRQRRGSLPHVHEEREQTRDDANERRAALSLRSERQTKRSAIAAAGPPIPAIETHATLERGVDGTADLERIELRNVRRARRWKTLADQRRKRRRHLFGK